MLAGFVHKFHSVLKGRRNHNCQAKVPIRQAKEQICQAKIIEGQVFSTTFCTLESNFLDVFPSVQEQLHPKNFLGQVEVRWG